MPLPASFLALFDAEPLKGDLVGVLGIVDVEPKDAVGDCMFGVLGVLYACFFLS